MTNNKFTIINSTQYVYLQVDSVQFSQCQNKKSLAQASIHQIQ